MEDDIPVLYVTGQCSFVHSLHDYCQEQFRSTTDRQTNERVTDETSNATSTATRTIETMLQHTTQNLSIAMMEQQIITMIVLPFFLAVPPPTVEIKLGTMKNRIMTDSYIHLYDLYSQNATYAVSLLQLFVAVVQMGGAAIQEEILQNGIVHVLSCSIRYGLIRAIKLKLYQNPGTNSHNKNNYNEFMQRAPKVEEQLQQSTMTTISPSYIPPLFVDAMVQFIDVCCGPPAHSIDALSPAMQIRRTSDMALTALFGFALDFDLWSSDVFAASTIFRAVADRYGCVGCVTTGYVLRSQISIQHLLDQIRFLRFDHYLLPLTSSSSSTTTPATTPPQQPTRTEKHVAAVESMATSLSRLLQSMLLSSLSNRRSIVQGEKDISACIGALCDCSLGSVTAHIALSALVGVLIWCEILPPEANPSLLIEPSSDDELKVEVASRLGRNLLVALFHEVVAPVLLSRTVFSGESSTSNVTSISAAGTSSSTLLCWQNHWRLNLLVFSWIAPIAGPEGIIASKSTGGLVLASALAGSLDGALDDAEKSLMTTLFMPSPAMALLIGATLRNEWSYKDLIADRLQVMIPMLPGMVVSLLTHPSNATSHKLMSAKSLNVLAEILTAVGGAFHRVFGGMVHISGQQSVKTRNNVSSEAIKAAKSYVPHLMIVVMILENHIAMRSSITSYDYAESPFAPGEHNVDPLTTEDDAVMDPDTDDLTGQSIMLAPSESQIDKAVLVKFLRSCQISVLDTACGFLSNAMSLGGAGAALPLWSSLLTTLDDSVTYAGSMQGQASPTDIAGGQKKSKDVGLADGDINDQSSDGGVSEVGDQWARTLSQNVLCRTIALVLMKSLNKKQQWDAWGYELCAALSKLTTLIDEKGLVSTTLSCNDARTTNFSSEQLFLLRSLLDILEHGRENSGWCQLRLPSMATDTKSGKPIGDMNANSKLMLPILLPCLRLVLTALSYVTPFVKKLHADSTTADKEEDQSLFERTLAELDQTLTASIVGLNFSSARDIALQALATFRKLITARVDTNDETTAQRLQPLFLKVVSELRYRYESERRLRDTALFDAYDEAGGTVIGTQAAHESLVVERLILGDVGIGETSSSVTEEIVFNSPVKAPKNTSMDFVLFHEPIEGQDAGGKVAFSAIEGLSAVLVECDLSNSSNDNVAAYDQISSVLCPYLDAWDALFPDVTMSSDVPKIFGTNVNLTSPAHTLRTTGLPFIGSDSAADAMSTFFEFSAAEKSRLQELSIRFFPSQRSSRKAFSERFCWARYMEIATFSVENLWERAVPDGNRDVRSRLPTAPCFPQFRRSLPKYLDDSSDHSETAAIVPAESPAKPGRHTSMTPLEMDTLTKTLLETGLVEIVDITKKEISDDEMLDSMQTSAADLGDDEEVAYDNEKDSEDVVSSQSQTDIVIPDSSAVDYDSEQINSADTRTQSEITTELSDKWHHSITASSFATPPDNSSSSLSLLHSAAAGLIERHVESCTHVKAEGNRQCTLLLTSSHLILEYDSNTDGLYEGELLAIQEDADRQRRMAADFPSSNEQSQETMAQQLDDKRQSEIASLRPKSIKWNLSEVSHVYLRRYRLRDSSLELFVIPTGGTSFGGFGIFSPASSLFLDFGSGHEATVRRDEAAKAIMRRVPPQAIKQWPDSSEEFLHDQLSRLTVGWVEGRITNFDYLLHINILSGRSYNDTCQYPVFPWVLADYTSNEVPDLSDKTNFRDLTKPVGALNPDRLKDFIERFNTFADPSIPPFMYGSHYSTSAGVVLHFLVRMHPFAGLHRQLQGGHFDVADRLFSSVPRTWSMCTGSSAAEVKELTPEWYCNPSFLRNENMFKLGTSQDGEVMGDVALPPWAKGSPEKFVEVMRAALESDICSEMLSDWIDLVFGRKQQGHESVKAHNVFFYLTYYGTVDVASIEDEALRKATELQIAHFGQCPMQLFKRPHIRRLPRDYFNLSIYQLFSAYTQRQLEVIQTESNISQDLDKRNSTTLNRARLHCIFGEPLFLPFSSAPLSHWVHLSAPPPGPHTPLVAVRLAGIDRCLAVDAKGIFHFFRWAWRNDELPMPSSSNNSSFDGGCFVAQRELPRFRTVPRLMFCDNSDKSPVVAISKTLFANRSVLLVLSNGDNHGSLSMQLVDPSKGEVRGDVLVPQVHAARITCIATDAIGTAAGHGGIGGELALVGSADGNASLWRFMSSHYLPLRPRLRLQGHQGSNLLAVALCSSIHIAVTLSSMKCCIHSLGNGSLSRTFGPPHETFDIPGGDDIRFSTEFANTSALAVSVQGFVIAVCETTIHSSNLPYRKVVSLNLFSVEGVFLGSTPLESWRGVPHKLYCTPDGTTVMVCCGRGVTIHRLSAWQPLKFLDEFQVTESDDFGSSLSSAWDIDLGPALNRPVVAVASCSGGALRLHALPGISAWSERNKKSGLTQTVGIALATPARRITNVVREGIGFGRQLAGMGRDIQREVTTDVKERGVGGFLGNVMSRMNGTNK